MIAKNKSVIGNVERELKSGFISVGENRLGWRRRYFAGFKFEPWRWANPHVAIVGGSGGGKSNACKKIVGALCSQGAKVAILDPHAEYVGISGNIGARVYDASRNGINIFDTDGMTEGEKASEVTGMMKRNFRLGEVQGYTLHKCIMYAYRKLSEEGKVPNIHNVLFAVKAFKRNSESSSEKTVLESLERRLALVASGAFEKSANMAEVMAGNSVFMLSKLHTPEAQSIYIEGFLRKVYSRMLSLEKTGRPNFYVVIDEAEKVGDNPIIGKIAAEGRKYGIGIIAISQRAKLMDRDLRANASALISFGIKEPEELNYVANFISGGNESGRFIEIKKALRSVGRGRALVVGAGMRNPVIVRFDIFDGGFESTEFIVSEASRGGILASELNAQVGKRAGSGIIEGMLADGRIKAYNVAAGRYIGKWYISDSHNSAEHDISVNIISRHLASIGVRNRIYNSAYGPDIMAFYGGRRIAIEYETGSKSIESSARMIRSRERDYFKTVVVTNDDALGRYAGIGHSMSFCEFPDKLFGALAA